jgi:hypothetical protein
MSGDILVASKSLVVEDLKIQPKTASSIHNKLIMFGLYGS